MQEGTIRMLGITIVVVIRWKLMTMKTTSTPSISIES
jgi:hypothetical protein